MKKPRLFFAGLIIGMVLTLGFLWIGLGQNSLAAVSTSNRPDAQAVTASISSIGIATQTPSYGLSDIGTPTPTQTPSSDLGSDEVPPTNLTLGANALSVLPTPIPGETLVYFVPSDNDATATVLYLYNTDSAAHIVALRGFSYNGVLVYSLNINIGASSFLRLASDSIASAPPPSWATPAPIITNFTDFTYFASLSLPKGVKAEGYTLFNPGTGVVNPRQDQGAIPLRFSTDPATLFLPIQQSNH
jgi:hypothetical protein